MKGEKRDFFFFFIAKKWIEKEYKAPWKMMPSGNKSFSNGKNLRNISNKKCWALLKSFCKKYYKNTKYTRLLESAFKLLRCRHGRKKERVWNTT